MSPEISWHFALIFDLLYGTAATVCLFYVFVIFFRVFVCVYKYMCVVGPR